MAICAIVLPIVSACSTSSSLPSLSPSDYPAATATAPSGYVVPASFAGSLTQPVNQYTGAQMWEMIGNTPKGGGHTRPRQCKSYINCFFSGGKTDVTITATKDAMFLNSTNAGEFGTIAAVVDGVSHDTEDYQFLKHDNYAFIVYPASGTQGARWVLQQVAKSGSSYVSSTVDQGTFHECTPGGRLYWTSSTADFLACGKAPHPAPSVQKMDITGISLVKVALDNILALFAGTTDPAWFACSSGCCTMAA